MSSNNLVNSTGGVSHYFDNDERDATRTLFVGNLDESVDRDELRRVFARFGHVEDLEIKRNQPLGHGAAALRKTYAFVKFENMDMAINAKRQMNAKKIARNEVKIGYGKFTFSLSLYLSPIHLLSHLTAHTILMHTHISSFPLPDAPFCFVLFVNFVFCFVLFSAHSHLHSFAHI